MAQALTEAIAKTIGQKVLIIRGLSIKMYQLQC